MHIMAGFLCSLDSLFEKNYMNFEKEIEITQPEVLCYSSLSSPMHLQKHIEEQYAIHHIFSRRRKYNSC